MPLQIQFPTYTSHGIVNFYNVMTTSSFRKRVDECRIFFPKGKNQKINFKKINHIIQLDCFGVFHQKMSSKQVNLQAKIVIFCEYILKMKIFKHFRVPPWGRLLLAPASFATAAFVCCSAPGIVVCIIGLQPKFLPKMHNFVNISFLRKSQIISS